MSTPTKYRWISPADAIDDWTAFELTIHADWASKDVAWIIDPILVAARKRDVPVVVPPQSTKSSTEECLAETN